MSPIYHFINGKIVSEKEAFISALDTGLLRGYGVFDYVQVYQGVPFHLMDHLQRLLWSCEQIELQAPMDLNQIYEVAYRVIEKNPPLDAGVRFIITGGNVSEDLLLNNNQTNLLVLYHPCKPLPEWVYSRGLKAVTTSCLRLLPAVKTTNYIPAVLGMKKAYRRGFDEAIYLNKCNELLEATTSNLFFFKEGTWITSDSGEIIKGVTRSLLIDLLIKDYPIEFRNLDYDEISSCEEAFLCSSVKDAVPLIQIDDQLVGSGFPGEHTARLRQKFREYIHNYKGILVCPQ